MEKRKIIDISLNIDELRKQKHRFIEGKKGTYLDLKVIELDNKEYNDFMIVVKVSKEDYEKGVKGEVVGYGKDWSLRGSSTPKPSAPSVDSDDLPF